MRTASRLVAALGLLTLPSIVAAQGGRGPGGGGGQQNRPDLAFRVADARMPPP